MVLLVLQIVPYDTGKTARKRCIEPTEGNLSIKHYKRYDARIRSPRIGPLKWLIKQLFRLIALAVVLLMLTLLVFRWVPLPGSAFIFNQNWLADKEPTRYKPARYTWVDWDDISPHLAMAVIASEDQRFISHWGLDTIEIRQAIKESRQQGTTMRGASTITQQVAKNLFLWHGRSYSRKGLELILSVVIELVWSKKRILEVYLNIAQFGNALFGVEEASHQWLGKSASEVSAEEAALLVTVLPRPALANVTSPDPQMIRKQRWVLQQMKQLGGVSYLKNIQ